MKKRILSVVLAGTVVFSGLLTGCGSTEKKTENTATEKTESKGEEKGSEDTIKIAVAGPMTGDNSEYGIGFNNAATMMAEQWNEKGGVLDKEIEIIAYDDKNTSEEATTIAQKIVSDKEAAGVIGHFASGVCMTAAPIYQENGIIEISPSSSHPDYAGIGDYIFRNNTIISKEAAASVDIAINDLGKKISESFLL